MCIDKMLKILPLLALLATAQTKTTPADSQLNLELSPGSSTAPQPALHTTERPYERCVTDKNEEGECVLYFLCDTNGTIIQDGTGIIDIRHRRSLPDSLSDTACERYLDTCCVLAHKGAPDNPITPAPTAESRRSTVSPDGAGVHTSQPREGCGWRNPEGVGLRLTGVEVGEANYAEFPWVVAVIRTELLNESDPNSSKIAIYVGGGSLIHPSVVLTGAQDVADVGTLRIRAGEWDSQTRAELYPYQERDVKQVTVHKDFNKGNRFYDIALLFLSSPVAAAPNVGVACLPSAGARAAAGTRCLASGWGKDVFGEEGRYQAILKKVELPVVEHARCERQLRRTRLGARFMLHSSFMCAGGELGADTCTGDGGSPLVCPAEHATDRYVQYGIVSWGIGCGEERPGVYVDVGQVRDWIDSQVVGQGYDPAVYTLP